MCFESRKGQNWYFCPRSHRLGEIFSPGRDQSRLGDGLGEEHEFASVILSLGRQNVAWARAPRLGEKDPAWARTPRILRLCPEKGYVLSRNEIVRPAMPRKESRKPRNESTDRKRLGRGPSRMDSFARRWNYRSVMSQEGTWGIEEERYS
ncbi:unnamed protein product [Lupinus luteus]|uniref:Uncharacterized protein n=1 Tax=Lupinus luteus TaxID=3873 RepID=A0AAV1VQM4_LUPLU